MRLKITLRRIYLSLFLSDANRIPIMKLILVNLILFLSYSLVSAQEFIPLWPKGEMPNSKGIELKEIIKNNRILQVDTPGIYTFFTSNEENTGGAVLICPSGGYHHLTYDLGGFQLAKWFNTIGMNAFVLIYRLPTSPDLQTRQTGPLQDAQRAMKIIRANAERWHIFKNNVGCLGASSGGHVASTLSTFSEDYSEIGDSLDTIAFLPDFQILISPVITMGTYAHKGSVMNLLGANPSEDLIKKYSNELNVTSSTPPCFIADAEDDKVVNPENSLLYFEALLKNHVPASLHVFPFGGHAINLTGNPGSTQLWIALCEAWLKEMEFNKIKER